VRAHSLPAVFGHSRVLSFQAVNNLGSGFRLSAMAALFDLATQAIDYGLATLLIFFKETQPVTNYLAGRRVAATLYLFLDEGLEVLTDCVA
jgi:hypothetical protein